MYDAVVVGARCAGASLATFLARAGSRVLVVDRDRLPSDHVISTHTIHPPGTEVLDDLGVGDAVRGGCPPSRVLRLRKNGAFADLTLEGGHAEYCPRRERLDGLLQDAAIRAGAELRDRTRATQVLFEGGRAVGVRLERGGGSEDVAARLVVGADGRRSFVADQVGAEEYLAYDAPRAMYWAYWDAPDDWWSDRFPFDMYLAHVGDAIRTVFQTDHGQLLIGSLPAIATARGWRADARRALLRDLAGDDVIGPLLDGAEPGSTVRGTLSERYFFRRAAGPGWVLVGDAGHHNEFVVGDGITEALLQARSLASAISEGTDDALLRWWRARDVEALPTCYWGRDEGALGAPAELETIVVGKVARDERLRRRMVGLPEHRCSPYDAVPMGTVLSAIGGALVRGRFGVVPEFLARARRVLEYRREVTARTRLLAAAS